MRVTPATRTPVWTMAPAAMADAASSRSKTRAIDDRRADALALDDDRRAVGSRRSAPRSAAPTIERRERFELVEGVEAEDAGAVHRRADEVVLFEDEDREDQPTPDRAPR